MARRESTMMSKQWTRGILMAALVVGSAVIASRSVQAAQAAEASTTEGNRAADEGAALEAQVQPSRPEMTQRTKATAEVPVAATPKKPVPYTQPGEPPAHLRRLSATEVPVPMRAGLHTILRQNRDKKVGALIPTIFEGKEYIARIETHYHPEGGPVRPWGHHRGISLFVERE
jgi:hypothetical protein